MKLNQSNFPFRLELSNTLYESSGQWWFSVDGVSLLYNASEEAAFNASEVYAPASSSYRCTHVSSLQRYSALLLPASERARRWAVTFTDFQIQAFNVTAGGFSPASDCATFLTPAILMGLVTSLILLLVLAYALHMVVHLKHIEHEDECSIFFQCEDKSLNFLQSVSRVSSECFNLQDDSVTVKGPKSDQH
uniref:ATPase H+ transporting accessory protein 1 like n=1 Tax=Salarias fasciatus TaxID=181472 RepID=A0A672FZK7_SALFA